MKPTTATQAWRSLHRLSSCLIGASGAFSFAAAALCWLCPEQPAGWATALAAFVVLAATTTWMEARLWRLRPECLEITHLYPRAAARHQSEIERLKTES